MLAKLLQHVLIWVGATVSILLGTLCGQSVGFVSHRMDRRVLAWTILSLSLIFAAALVQRAPAAVAVLTILTALLGGFGLWLLADGAQSTGLIYFVIGPRLPRDAGAVVLSVALLEVPGFLSSEVSEFKAFVPSPSSVCQPPPFHPS